MDSSKIKDDVSPLIHPLDNLTIGSFPLKELEELEIYRNYPIKGASKVLTKYGLRIKVILEYEDNKYLEVALPPDVCAYVYENEQFFEKLQNPDESTCLFTDENGDVYYFDAWTCVDFEIS